MVNTLEDHGGFKLIALGLTESIIVFHDSVIKEYEIRLESLNSYIILKLYS